MVAQFVNTSNDFIPQLLSGLKLIPPNWALTPVLGNKNPYRADWNQAVPMSRRQLIAIIEGGDTVTGKDSKFYKIYPQGYGLRTGKWSGGILALDADGAAAQNLLNQMGELPKTVSFTSGKPGRCQYLVRVPKEYWSVIETKKINTGIKGEDGKDQLLEFRWHGCQSVLPPSVHPETGRYQWVNSPKDIEVAESPTWLIEYFLNNSATGANKAAIKAELLPSSDVPLYQCLSRDDRELIDSGVGEGSRDDSGAKLARNLIGTAARLNQLGYQFFGDPRALFDDYCSRCSPPLSTKDAERIWRSAEKSNPTPTLTDDAIENCVKAWKYNQSKGIGSNREQAIAPRATADIKPMGEQLSGDELITHVDRLIAEELPLSKVKAALGKNINVYHERLKEQEQSLDRDVAAKQLPSLFEAQKAKLLPHQVLWGDGGKLAKLMTEVASNMPVKPEFLLTTLFPVAGSRIGTSSQLVINASTNYTATCIFWSCIVAETGKIKTPAQSAVIKPLMRMESEEYENWKVAVEDYKNDMKKAAKTNDPMPDEPSPRKRFVVHSCTTETRMKRHGENPRGLLYHRDEWIGFLSGLNKYRNGKGDDEQIDLSEFNGDALLKDVMDSEKSVFLEQSAISRTGNTQTDVLKAFMADKNFSDASGKFARWLFCFGDDAPDAYIDLFTSDDGTGNKFQDELTWLYKSLDRLPERDYLLSDDAKRIYQAYQHKIIDWSKNERHPGLRAAYPKLQTYLGRFALLLHLVNAVLAGKQPDVSVNGRTMQAAVNVVNFYLAQVKLLYAINGEQDSLTGLLLKLKEFIDKKPEGVTARQIQAGNRDFRKIPSSVIKEHCQTLVNTGCIKLVKNTYYPFLGKSADTADKVLTDCQHTETPPQYGFEKSADTADTFFNDFQNYNQLVVDSTEQTIKSSSVEDDVSNTPIGQNNEYIDKECQQCQQNDETLTQQASTSSALCQHFVSSVSPSCEQLYESNDPAVIEANAELIRESIAEQDWGMITTLTQKWSTEFKTAVWALLTADERSSVKNLKSKLNNPEPEKT
ncbi:DUF3987 domain-containing protein [Nostoc sp. CCY0012]|uniref:DUF3987 domain-containing protein n=1 Tax=Nostoc sp. CCY0012 TaxID=1056123 RepID=UPI0039C731D7